MRETPHSRGLRQPAEWEPHEACWVAWPSHASLWQEDLAAVQQAVALMCQAIAGSPGGERLEVLAPDGENEKAARHALAGLDARYHRIPFGDIWLRDTAPVFVNGASGLAAVTFGFNGWGGKYVLEHDDQVSAAVARAAGLPVFTFEPVMEGGSVDVDGEGTAITTEQCLLNPNRNPGMSRQEVEALLRDSLGAERVLWLGEGLLNDHTDGHVDNLARFVGPGRVACMRPSGADPNRAVLEKIWRQLGGMKDARGRHLEVTPVPSPGRVMGPEGKAMPASSLNFFIGNGAVVVPVYGTPHDGEITAAIARLFPGRRIVGVDARAMLTGGGAFHCITQQQPAGHQERATGGPGEPRPARSARGGGGRS